jgi:hypothetical protein
VSARAWDRRRRKDRTVYLVWSGGWRDEDTVMAAFDREDDAQAWLAASEFSRMGHVESCPLNPPRPVRTWRDYPSEPTTIPAADLDTLTGAVAVADLHSLGWRQIAAAACAPVGGQVLGVRLLGVVHLARWADSTGMVLCGYTQRHPDMPVPLNSMVEFPDDTDVRQIPDVCPDCLSHLARA